MGSALLERERAVLAGLMRSPALAAGDALAAIRQATEAASRLLHVRRASLWTFGDERRHIECVDLFDAATGEHSAGTKLFQRDAPAYFARRSRIA